MKTGVLLLAMMLAPSATFGASPSPPSVQLSLAGEFYSAAPLPEASSGWFALSVSGGSFDLLSTRVEIQRLPHECSGTITRVVAVGAKNPVFVVRGSPRFKPGPLDSVFHGHRFLNPGESLSFKLKWGDSFRIQAFGTVKPAQGGPRYTDYQLVLSGKSVSQVIVDISVVNSDAKPTLLWAGDLDRDDKLDALINLPTTYVSDEYVLLLSSPAAAGEHVRRAAIFRTGGC